MLNHAPPFRIGIVACTREQPLWVRLAISGVVESGQAIVQVVAVLPPSSNGFEANRSARSPLLRRAYDWFDAARFRPDREIFEFGAVAENDARTIREVFPKAPDDCQGDVELPAELVRLLTEAPLDLVLNLHSHTLTSRLAPFARYGAAMFSVGGEFGIPGTHGFEELIAGEPVITVSLELFEPKALHPTNRISTTTNTHAFSAGRTRAQAAWHSIALLDRLVRALRLSGPDASGQHSEGSHQRIEPSRNPDAAGTLAPLIGVGMRYTQTALRERLMREQWILAYHRERTTRATSDDVPFLKIDEYQTLMPPSDRFWADPFPIRYEGRDFILFEELLYRTDKGHISVIELGPDGIIHQPQIVLDRPYHLSYPFLFDHDGEHYMIPECATESRLEVYRATRFPYEWELDRVMLEGTPLLDATIAEIDGRWWMFACPYDERLRPWNDLVLYYAASPLGPWTPHPLNPVVSDVRHARPAGRIFQENGVYKRPAQDCSTAYGGALTIRRITKLTTLEYEEVGETYLEGERSRGVFGLHTINASSGLSVIDLKRRIRA